MTKQNPKEEFSMNNIIQLIMEKVKREIEENIIKALEGDAKLDDMVDSVGEMVNDIGVNTLLEIIEQVDEQIRKSPERKGKYHVHKKSVERSLITRFGELEFERTYYKNILEKRYVYMLDELLGVKKYERIEGNLKADILEKQQNFLIKSLQNYQRRLP